MEIKYYKTISIAYVAASTHLNVKKEPWLHLRLVSLQKFDGKQLLRVQWYAVVYVWDTREIVQWVEIDKSIALDTRRWTKANDNGRKLMDKNNLVPNWAKPTVYERDEPRYY